MINGPHQHECKECGRVYECHLVTHCRRDEPDGPPAFCEDCIVLHVSGRATRD